MSKFVTKNLALGAAMVLLGLLLSAERSTANDYSEQQRDSLAAVFYRGNPLPPPPTDLELKEVRTKVRKAPRWERRLLRQLYGRDRELWVYATRDSDGDGIFDFRVSDYYGRFLDASSRATPIWMATGSSTYSTTGRFASTLRRRPVPPYPRISTGRPRANQPRW
jgi:hypothetical protein